MRQIAAGLLLLACTGAAAGEGPFRHAEAAYPHLTLTWQPAKGAAACERIWSHPLLPGVAALTGEAGMSLTQDGGTTWSAPRGLPAGAVGGVAFHPSRPAEALVATAEGLWRSQDGGRSFARLAAPALPPATGVWYHPRDPLGRIILVTHGDQAPGLSVSSDNGASWKRVITDYHVHRIFPCAIGEQPMALLASPMGDLSTRSLICMATLGEKPVEALRDGAITDGANTVHLGKLHFASPRDGLQRLEAPWDHGIGEVLPVQTSQSTDNGFAAVDFSWGAHADRQLMFLFDPFGQGVVYNEGGEDWFPASTGLPLGAMVKDGAQFKANANGSRFYAILNDQAFVGRPLDLRLDGLQVQADPPVALVQAHRYGQAVAALGAGFVAFNKSADPLATARGMGELLDGIDQSVQPAVVRLRAQLAAGAVPERLTVDLTRFGMSSVTPLYDDGRHGDGAAGDRSWAADVRIRPNRLNPERNEWRRTPGILGLSVTAHWPDGVCSGAVAPLLVWSVVERLSLADTHDKPQERLKVEGAALTVVKTGKREDPEMRLVAAGGPWQLTVRFNYGFGRSVDMARFAAVGFDWRGGAARLHLRDAPMFDEPHESAPVAFSGAMLGAADADGWREAAVPVASLVPADSPFNRNDLVALVFSGDAKPGEEFSLRSPCLLPEAAP